MQSTTLSHANLTLTPSRRYTIMRIHVPEIPLPIHTTLPPAACLYHDLHRPSRLPNPSGHDPTSPHSTSHRYICTHVPRYHSSPTLHNQPSSNLPRRHDRRCTPQTPPVIYNIRTHSPPSRYRPFSVKACLLDYPRSRCCIVVTLLSLCCLYIYPCPLACLVVRRPLVGDGGRDASGWSRWRDGERVNVGKSLAPVVECGK